MIETVLDKEERGRRHKEEGGTRSKEQRGGGSDEEVGATRRVKKKSFKKMKNEKVARGRIVDPRGLVVAILAVSCYF